MARHESQLSSLRELLYHEPAETVWTALCALLDGWDPATVHLGVAYAADHLASWPDLLREPPAAWRQAALEGHPPEGWPLVRLVDLVLEHPGNRRLYTIKALRELLNCGLREAVELSEQVPVVLLEGIGGATAQRLARPLEEVGATIRLRPSEVAWGAAAHGEGILHPRPVEAFAVTLKSVEDLSRAISIVREATDRGIQETYNLLRQLPAVIAHGLPWLAATRLVRELEAGGAEVWMEVCAPRPTFSVTLEGAGTWKIAVIKVLCEHLSLSFAEARQLVEAAPAVIREAVTAEEAEAIAELLRAEGATIRLHLA